ncbi:hypothetical protein ACJX0J_015780, partial [Zea mays]
VIHFFFKFYPLGGVLASFLWAMFDANPSARFQPLFTLVEEQIPKIGFTRIVDSSVFFASGDVACALILFEHPFRIRILFSSVTQFLHMWCLAEFGEVL